MAKLKDYIFGFLASLLLLSSHQAAESKELLKSPDFDSITNLDKIELVSDPQPLVLKQLDYNHDSTFAGHRSHSSHRSHYSHRSGSSGPQANPQPDTARPPSQSDPKPDTTPPSSQSTPSPSGKWRATTEWVKHPYALFHHSVIVVLLDGSVYQGLVTNCREDAIEIRMSQPEQSSVLVEFKNIKSLVWQ